MPLAEPYKKNDTQQTRGSFREDRWLPCAIFPGAVISDFTQLQTIYFLSEHLFEAAQEIVGLCLGEAERRKEAKYVG